MATNGGNSTTSSDKETQYQRAEVVIVVKAESTSTSPRRAEKSAPTSRTRGSVTLRYSAQSARERSTPGDTRAEG